MFQLLGELLLDRHNFTIMTKYISRPDNLKLMMNLLRDKSRNIQFEAFHGFKVTLRSDWVLTFLRCYILRGRAVQDTMLTSPITHVYDTELHNTDTHTEVDSDKASPSATLLLC